MELTKTVKDKTFDDYFTEVDHSESISEDRPGSMRLFYLNVRSGKIKIADLEKFTMLNIGRYVFSRAKQEQYEKAGNLDAVMQQALRIMRKRGAADAKGTGNELMVSISCVLPVPADRITRWYSVLQILSERLRMP